MRGRSSPMARPKWRSTHANLRAVYGVETEWLVSRRPIARRSSRFTAVMACDAGIALAVLIVEASRGISARGVQRRSGIRSRGSVACSRLLERAWNRRVVRRRHAEVARHRDGAALSSGSRGRRLGSCITFDESRESRHGVGLVALIATTGLAQRSLYRARATFGDRVERQRPRRRSRAPSRVSSGATRRSAQRGAGAAAAIESLAEELQRRGRGPGILACSSRGLPGLFAYKALNTADSMIGHIEPRWRHFGWAAARLDDRRQLSIPARIAGAAASRSPGRAAFAAMWRDAPKHASPNAGLDPKPPRPAR